MGYGITRNSNRKWPRGFLFYKCAGGTDAAIRRLKTAFMTWNRQLGGYFVFKEVQTGENFGVEWQVIEGVKTKGEWVSGDDSGQNGRVPGGVIVGTLKLGEEMTLGTMLHEIGHMLGLSHENSRPDSTDPLPWDTYWREQYGHLVEQYGEYDTESIMHYGNYSRKIQVSQGDVDTIKAIYGF